MNYNEWVHYTVHKAAIERAEKAERASRMDASAFRTLCSAIQQIEEMVGIDSGGWNGPGEAMLAVEAVVCQRDRLKEALEAIASEPDDDGFTSDGHERLMRFAHAALEGIDN